MNHWVRIRISVVDIKKTLDCLGQINWLNFWILFDSSAKMQRFRVESLLHFKIRFCIIIIHIEVCLIILLTIASFHVKPSCIHTKSMLLFHVVLLILTFNNVIQLNWLGSFSYREFHCISPYKHIIVILSYRRYVPNFDKNSNEV